MKNSLLKILAQLFFGRKSLQGFFESLHRISLYGMNFGAGGVVKDSGELFAIKWVNKQLKSKQEAVVFDVGANIGLYTKALCDVFPQQTKIHVFEPSEPTFKIMANNVTDYTKHNLTLNNIGFGDKQEEVKLYTNKEGSGWASIYNREVRHYGFDLDKVEKIQLSTIDEYCANNNIERIDFLKLDIEGNELNALLGANKMLKEGRIEHIQFEFGGSNIDSKTYFQDYFYKLYDDYKVYRVLKNGLQEIKNYSEVLEVFLTVNYLAVKK